MQKYQITHIFVSISFNEQAGCKMKKKFKGMWKVMQRGYCTHNMANHCKETGCSLPTVDGRTVAFSNSRTAGIEYVVE